MSGTKCTIPAYTAVSPDFTRYGALAPAKSASDARLRFTGREADADFFSFIV